MIMEKLAKRVVSGFLVVFAVVAAAFWLPSVGVCLLLVTIATLALMEFYSLVGVSVGKILSGLGLLLGALLIVATWSARTLEWTSRPDLESLAIVVVVFAFFLRLLSLKNNDNIIVKGACAVFGVLYVSVLFNYFTKLVFEWGPTGWMSAVGTTGRLLFFYLLAVVKVSDIGAYFIGSKFGRKKLMSRVSPAKTWEGCIGGVLSGFVASIVFFVIRGGQMGAVTMSWFDAVVLGLLLPVMGIIGDLGESMLKRSAGSKDSSAVIPGLGGLLDVLDSLLFTVPVLYFYAIYVFSSSM